MIHLLVKKNYLVQDSQNSSDPIPIPEQIKK